jgi:hypothetical protein
MGAQETGATRYQRASSPALGACVSSIVDKGEPPLDVRTIPIVRIHGAQQSRMKCTAPPYKSY